MLQSIYTHAGCDEIGHPVWTLFDVSIHTPTQGVTSSSNITLLRVCFNPHTHAGCDITRLYLNSGISSFNPHTHAGCDSARNPIHHLTACFNPHTHAGCDLPCILFNIKTESFNPHTHAGCDRWHHETNHSRFVSIHTPTQGVTPR